MNATVLITLDLKAEKPKAELEQLIENTNTEKFTVVQNSADKVDLTINKIDKPTKQLKEKDIKNKIR